MPSAREPENLARMLHCGGKASGELRSIGRGPGGAGSNHGQARSVALRKSRLLGWAFARTPARLSYFNIRPLEEALDL